ncbi:melanoma-associated antigen B16-like [Orycteropus afer afer]|uniref:Melanoma-associated antigen B16-like n=1 Tax=Orycteropus afer afer TaxID=1230840 RepID=A0AC54Z6V5_ORYAF|nr:melanoma-associated antigen B16-like [Orycteropus afer afer]
MTTQVHCVPDSVDTPGLHNSEEEDATVETASTILVPQNIECFDEKVYVLVDFLLFRYQRKELITKADMLKMVIQEYEDHFPEIFQRVSKLIDLIFGLEMKEVDPISHGYTPFIELGLTYDGVLSKTKGVPKTGLLIVMLGVIFLNNNYTIVEEIWYVLNALEIRPGELHSYFGCPKKLITEEFVQERYLEYHSWANSNPACYEFVWGPRIHAEIMKMKLLEFWSRVHGAEWHFFPSRYEEALKDEEERESSVESDQNVQ